MSQIIHVRFGALRARLIEIGRYGVQTGFAHVCLPLDTRRVESCLNSFIATSFRPPSVPRALIVLNPVGWRRGRVSSDGFPQLLVS